MLNKKPALTFMLAFYNQYEIFWLKKIVKAYKDKIGTVNSMATISARTFSAEETPHYAGGMDDPERMAGKYGAKTDGV